MTLCRVFLSKVVLQHQAVFSKFTMRWIFRVPTSSEKNLTGEIRGCWVLLHFGSTTCLGGSSRVGGGNGFSSSRSHREGHRFSSSSYSSGERNPLWN